MTPRLLRRRALALLAAAAALVAIGNRALAAGVYLRVRVLQPAGEKVTVAVDGYRRRGPGWFLPRTTAEATSGHFTEWIDLSAWPFHERVNASGGLDEWPSLRVWLRGTHAFTDVSLEVELADRPDPKAVVKRFVEKGTAGTIAFILPTPLREHAKEIETGSAITERQLGWARAATSGKPIALSRFTITTALASVYDPALGRKWLEALRLLGFNIAYGIPPGLVREAGMRMRTQIGLYNDPDEGAKKWREYLDGRVKDQRATADGDWMWRNLEHAVIADEVRPVPIDKIAPERRDAWFRDWLRASGVTDAELGTPVAEAHFPEAAIEARTLPRGADLATRKLDYWGARFLQAFFVKRIADTAADVKRAMPWMQTSTLPSDHGFFGAFGAPALGMSYAMHDLFSLGRAHTVDMFSSEDWLGLNHMYGPNYTWTGAQSFEYFTAILRCAIGDTPVGLEAVITPSDAPYLRLKAAGALAQGAKAFYFWAYGPTYLATENYWSDLESEYDGIAHVTRTLAADEALLYAARPVRDPVAIVYSVSHDLWYPDDAAAFVEKRLLWHALRHVGVQPDFLDEEALAGGALGRYRVLYLTDWCLSRKAAAAIDAWVRAGGVLYLSAGAATRDEYHEPLRAGFTDGVWPEAGGAALEDPQPHAYNERVDLPLVKPIDQVQVGIGDPPFTLPALGARMHLRSGAGEPWAHFSDGTPAGVTIAHGAGKVVAAGFLPMLAYGQLAAFKPRTLEERWPEGPRRIARLPLALGGVEPAVRTSADVVEASLLDGPEGAAVVLANYTYAPIADLAVDVRLADANVHARSVEGAPLRTEPIAGGLRVHLPLAWTDVVLLRH